MHPQATNQMISRPKARRPAASKAPRCQKVWQMVFVVATLALAMAAQAAPRCVEVFSGARPSLKAAKSATIHFNYGRLTNADLQAPDVRQEVLRSIEIDLGYERVTTKTLEAKIEKLSAKRETSSRASLLQDLTTDLRVSHTKITELRKAASQLESGATLSEMELHVLTNRTFSEDLAYNGKVNVRSFAERLKQLDERGALVTNKRIPPSRIARVVRLIGRNKIFTLILVATLAQSGYQLYQALPHQAAAVAPEFQETLVYEH